MKKLIGLVTIAAVAVGVTFAQEKQVERRQRAPQQREQRESREPRKIETVTVSGTLKLEKGIVAVQSGENTHLVPMLNRYIGFISGLQEGKTISVEGFAMRNMLHPQKVTINGKEYEFGRAMFAQAMPRQQFAPRNAPNRYAPHQRFHAPRKGNDRNREDRPNREERARRNAPAGSSQVITDQV